MTKPWKPYDVEQAKAEILAEAARRTEYAREAIDDVAHAAVALLEAQAQTFAKLPRDTGSLFGESSAVMIGALEPHPHVDGDLQVRDILALTNYNQHSVTHNAQVTLPRKKHRVLVFFIPED